MADKDIIQYQRKVLEALSGRINDFYLAGGTALSLFYFRHRLSVDLDFFTGSFSGSRIKEVMEYIETGLKAKVKLAGQISGKGKARVAVYNVFLNEKVPLKVDFVEDFISLIKKPESVGGINIMSLEDIYIRKIFAIAGITKIADTAGKTKFIGGRSEAKDFFDLYYLSHTFMPLSGFVKKYCDATSKESMIHWFRTYDRMDMMNGILELKSDKKVDYKTMERHFAKETNAMLEDEIGGI